MIIYDPFISSLNATKQFTGNVIISVMTTVFFLRSKELQHDENDSLERP